jgi:catechol 2,3-dioxygenase-like lactoylglutathione lyase family enzyme
MGEHFLEKVTHVQVPVQDVQKAVEWYTKYLGCETDMVSETNAILRWTTGPTIFLWKTTDQTTSTFTVNGEPFPTIGIETLDMAGFKNYLEDAGIQSQLFLHEAPGYKFLKFFDPDGNMFVIHEDPKV